MRKEVADCRYYATVCPGLEFITVQELAEKVPDSAGVTSEQGRVHFDFAGDPHLLLELRSVNHLFCYLGCAKAISPTQSGLEQLKQLGAAVDTAKAVGVLQQLGSLRGLPFRSPPAFRVTGHRTGEHQYNSHAVAGAVGAGLCDATDWQVDLTDFDLDIHVTLRDTQAVLGLRLTPESLHRRNRVKTGRATLKATVAYALLRLAEVRETDVVVDAMCGGGTIPLEATQVTPARCVAGGDLDRRAVNTAALNRAAAASSFDLLHWDACRLPLATHSVDRVLVNLPFGVRVGSHRKNRHLYAAFLTELDRVLSAAGRAVLLTMEVRLMASLLLDHASFELVARHPVNIGGLVPSVYILERRSAAPSKPSPGLNS